jgi:hypothetical protein
MTPNEAGKELEVTPRTIIEFVRRGLLVGQQHPFSRRWTIDAVSVRKLLRSVKAEQTPPRGRCG